MPNKKRLLRAFENFSEMEKILFFEYPGLRYARAKKICYQNFCWGNSYPIFIKTFCRHQKNLVIQFIFKKILRLKFFVKKTDFYS